MFFSLLHLHHRVELLIRFKINCEREVGRLIEALEPVRAMPPAHRPASLVKIHKKLNSAWHNLSENERGKSTMAAHACLGSTWFQQYESPTLFGFVKIMVDLWMETPRSVVPPAGALALLARFTPLADAFTQHKTSTEFSNAIVAARDKYIADARAKAQAKADAIKAAKSRKCALRIEV